MFEVTFSKNNIFISITAAARGTNTHLLRLWVGGNLTIRSFPNKKSALAAAELLLS
jgi:hypothetical protein